MAKVIYGNLIESISGNFGSSNAYVRGGVKILRKRRGPQTGQTPAQQRERNAARYIGMALTTGTPELTRIRKLLQTGKFSGDRNLPNRKNSSWYANFYATIRKSLNNTPTFTDVDGYFFASFGSLTLHKEPVLADYVTWTGRDTERDAVAHIIYTQWNESGKWDVTNQSTLDFNAGSYTFSLLPNIVIMFVGRETLPNIGNIGDCWCYANNIDLNITPSL